MNTITPRRILVAGLMATLGFAAMAQTPPPPAAGDAPRHARHQGMPDPAKMEAFHAKRQAELKAKLKLSAEQESAWTTFTNATKPPARHERPDPAEMAKLTTPERIDRMQARHEEMAKLMNQRAEATKAFYAALNPEQKKVFDTETQRMMPPGHMMRRPGGGEHRHHG